MKVRLVLLLFFLGGLSLCTWHFALRTSYFALRTSVFAWSALAFQEGATEAKQEDPAAEAARKRKRLQEIEAVKDPAEKRTLLEQYIQENPQGPHLNSAYRTLGDTLLQINPATALEWADQVLAQSEEPPGVDLHKLAYRLKASAYRKEKDEEALRELAEQVLETQTDPGLLHDFADYDKASAFKYYEKAIAEREKTPESSDFPSLGHLYVDLANEWKSKEPQKAEQILSRVIEIGEKDLSGLEGLPADDPKRRRLDMVRSELGNQYLTLMRWLAELGENEKVREVVLKAAALAEKRMVELEALPEEQKKNRVRFVTATVGRQYQSIAQALGKAGYGEEGLSYLDKAAALQNESDVGERARLEKTRAELHDQLGNQQAALEHYVRSFAFRMDQDVRKKIEALAAREYFELAREIRTREAQPFKPFELKTVEGEVRRFEDFKNKVTLVNFFFPT